MKNITRRGFLQLTAFKTIVSPFGLLCVKCVGLGGDGSGVCGSTADGMREEKYQKTCTGRLVHGRL